MRNILIEGNSMAKMENQVIIGAHKGYSFLFPENTMAAYRGALEKDIDEIELDIRLTKDGVPVLIHDATVERTTNGQGSVSNFTFDELQKLDAGFRKGEQFAGEKIPAFEEFLEYIRPYKGLLLNVEIKEKTFETVDKAVALLEQYGLTDRYVITCFNAAIVKYASETYQVKCQGFPSFLMTDFEEGIGGTYSKLYSVGIKSIYLSEETVSDFQQMGLQIWSYTPDSEEEVRRHILLGSKAIVCNNVEPAIRVLTEMGLRGTSGIL